MTVRIAFTSCSDPFDAPTQPVWDMIAKKNPTHLVLLGDQIYMDYKFGLNPRLGKSAGFSNLAFANAMYDRYSRQCAILRKSKLLALQNMLIHGIWDDHDFAWNNSYGDSGSNNSHAGSNPKDPVPRDKQMISRRLMRDFFKALRNNTYPANPVTSDDVSNLYENLAVPMFCSEANTGPRVRLDDGAALLLTDDRSFKTLKSNPSQGTVLGNAQSVWIAGEMNDKSVIVLAIGLTLNKGTDNLSQYADYEDLKQQARAKKAKVLCLTGDAHKIEWRRHGRKSDFPNPGDQRGRIHEAVASGAARPHLFGNTGAFGIVEVTDNTLTVSLFQDSETAQETHVIDRGSWAAT